MEAESPTLKDDYLYMLPCSVITMLLWSTVLTTSHAAHRQLNKNLWKHFEKAFLPQKYLFVIFLKIFKKVYVSYTSLVWSIKPIGKCEDISSAFWQKSLVTRLQETVSQWVKAFIRKRRLLIQILNGGT